MDLIYNYSEAFESWVFTTLERAETHINIFKAFQAKTWGEFKSLMPSDEYKWTSEILIEKQFEEELYEPQDLDSFDHYDFVEDGEYPGYLVYENKDILPNDIIMKYGEEIVTIHDGAYFRIPKHEIENVIADLKENEIKVEYRPDLDFTQ